MGAEPMQPTPDDEFPSSESSAEDLAGVIAALDDLEGTAIELAVAGQVEAGMDILQLCIDGLREGSLSDALRYYLADRLADVVSGMKPDRALNIEVVRDKEGRPKTPFPDWEYPLAALGALMSVRSYRPARIVEAMDDLRQRVEGKGLDPKEARRILKKYAEMSRLDERTLVAVCDGLDLRGEMEKFPPLPKT